MTRIHDLTEYGQAIWLDYIRRSFLDSGGLQALIDQGVRGVTSNPSIFEKAIAGSSDYDGQIQALVAEGCSPTEIYEALALQDIGRAADMLRPVYDMTDGADGYVSLEVDPTLAYETERTISEARRLFAALDRPNIMIKVPATKEGIPAIETLIGEGININVTLMFSLDHYDAVSNAYITGLETLAASGGNVSRVASVASFFVSRVDGMVDKALAEVGNQELQGKIAVANAKMAYARFEEVFSGERWQRLADMGARVQRPLWASTSTKNPTYPDTLYVDTLIGPHTVNTLPTKTLNAFLDHGTAALTVRDDMDAVRAQLAALADAGVDLDAITDELQTKGVDSFAKAFAGLMASVTSKCERFRSEEGGSSGLGKYEATVNDSLAQMRTEKIVERIWAHDHTVWKPEPTEITNRLGWLHSPTAMQEKLDGIRELVQAVQADGYTHVLLLGMGGSSLAPEVFRKTYGVADGHLDLDVLDSTDPGTVLAYANQLDPAKTLYIVATKSGGTVETLSFFKYFYNQTIEHVGREQAGQHFVAITDPGSKLVTIAQEYNFRATFVNDPNIGGRYSVLSYFGLVPAALVGVDLSTLLERASEAASNAQTDVKGVTNQSAYVGAVMGTLAAQGRDKLTFISSAALSSFGDWVEQLIAESTGKEGHGILPVVGEPVGSPDAYGADRLFVYLRLEGDTTHDAAVAALEAAGQPVIRFALRDRYDLGQQFFLWEMATAISGHFLKINPFDQPNVESAKVLARRMVAQYMETGNLPAADMVPLSADALQAFLSQAQAGDYISLQAYIQPTTEADEGLQAFRTTLRNNLKLATTVGYGPRFLHSTGQLHKGDGGNGLFILFVADVSQDAPIPNQAGASDSEMSFNTLKLSQALGDQQALKDNQRRIIRFDLGSDISGGLGTLTSAVG